MSSQSIEKFKQYLETQNDTFLQDGRRIEGIIRDIFPEEKSLIFLLTSAWKAGIVSDLRQTANLEVTIAQFGDRLCQECGFSESSALSAVRVWAYALGVTDDVPNISISRTPSTVSQSSITAETKKCPFCAEEVKKDARKCRYCHSDISDDAVVKGASVNERQADKLMRQQEALAREKQKLERERQEIEKMKALEIERQKLEAERSKLAEEKKQLANDPTPAFRTPWVTRKDGRFIEYFNGTDGAVLDIQTNLMWGTKCQSGTLNWADAKSYCNNYSKGGYMDWRMPTQDELAELYASGARNQGQPVVSWLKNDNVIWASETNGSDAASFYLGKGLRLWRPQIETDGSGRQYAIPVRFATSNQAMPIIKHPQVPLIDKLKELGRDGRFIAYDNGTVLDTKSGLIWAAKDNGSNISWRDGKSYCESYRGGGYTDWRMPVRNELDGLYDRNKSYKYAFGFLVSNLVHLTDLIRLTNCEIWASITPGDKAKSFNFSNNSWNGAPESYASGHRALPVRSGK